MCKDLRQTKAPKADGYELQWLEVKTMKLIETDWNCLFKMLVQIHGQLGDHLPLGTNSVDDTRGQNGHHSTDTHCNIYIFSDQAFVAKRQTGQVFLSLHASSRLY